MKVVTYLSSLVLLCCGEGGTLQTNITGMCGEFLQCMDYTGFAPAQGVCAFPVYTAQSPGCSAGELSEVDLGLRALPGLSCSGSGSWVLHKGADFIGPAFCALPRTEQLRRPGARRVQSPQVGGAFYRLPRPSHSVFQVHSGRAFSGVRVSPLGS